MNKFRLVIALVILQLSGCTTLDSVVEEEKSKTKVYIDQNNTLNYEGSITEEANTQLFKLYKQLETKPQNLKVSSPGGNVMFGLELGNWILDRQLNVIVGRVCASSCANYVFPAGKTKYLHKHSALIWHGNSYQENIDKMYQEDEEGTVKYREAENAFNKKVNIHPMLAEYGHKEFTFWNFLYHYFKETVGYDYSINDMQKFGLTNIVLVDKTWEWREYHPQHHVIRVKVNANDLASQQPLAN